MTTENKTLRCWRDDYRIAEEFCEKYGLSYGEQYLDNREPYSVFFIDVDGDEICCCVSKNTERSFEKGIVQEEDIVLYIPLNERDLKKDLHKELLEFWQGATVPCSLFTNNFVGGFATGEVCIRNDITPKN